MNPRKMIVMGSVVLLLAWAPIHPRRPGTSPRSRW